MKPNKGAAQLLARRVGRGESANKAAKFFGTDRDTYLRWEAGSSLPTLRNVARVADLAGIPWRDWLEVSN